MTDAIWDGFVSGDWDTVSGTGPMGPGTNWNPGVLPDGTATFAAGAFNTIITFSANQTTIQNIKFTGGLYSFGVGIGGPSSQNVNITGGGLVNAQGQIFNVFAFGSLEFQNSSTADKATIDVASAPSGSSFFPSSRLIFTDSSTLGGATVNNQGYVEFFGNSNAGAVGAGATIINSGDVDFNGNSTAGGVTIVNNSGGDVFFENTSHGGNASIVNNAGGVVAIGSGDHGLSFAGSDFSIGSITGPGQIQTGTLQTGVVTIEFVGTSGPSHSLASTNLASGIGGASAATGTFIDTISGVISGGGGIAMDALGTLTLSAVNTYTGDTVINAGTIELAQGGSIAGNLDFHVAGPSATIVETLKLDATNQIGGVINGYAQGDAIDFAFHTFATGDHAVWVENAANTGGTLSLLTGASTVITTLNLSGVYTSAEFTLASDGNGGAVFGSTAMSPTTVQQEDLGLYMALYNRAAEFPGYLFWIGTVAQQPDGAGVTITNAGSTAVTLNDAAVLGQDFVNTQATFFNQTYASLNDSAFINALYVNIGGNAGDPDGIAFWASLLAQAEASGESVQAARAGLAGQFVHDLIDVNLANFTTLTPAQLLAAEQRQETINNKIAVSLAYSNASQGAGGAILDPQAVGDAAYNAATTVLQSVTFDPATVTAAITGINNAVAHQNLVLI